VLRRKFVKVVGCQAGLKRSGDELSMSVSFFSFLETYKTSGAFSLAFVQTSASKQEHVLYITQILTSFGIRAK
jgi:hypothetical protein